MPRATKIATCSYCGTRAALEFDGRRHELVCTACGAPLHELKALRADAVEPEAHRPPAPGAKGRRRDGRRVAPAPPAEVRGPAPARVPPKALGKKKKRKRKSVFRKALSEVVDAIEDIFD
jgi:hypothetical protein